MVRGVGDDRLLAIVHRQRYDDWSFAKGKADDGETSEQTALREVEEETGMTCRIVGAIDTIHYPLATGATKEVEFFLMRPIGVDRGAFTPNSEVDELRWISPDDAREQLTYSHDRGLLDHPSFDRLAKSGTVHLFRHVHAGSRRRWDGDDRLRPVSAKGRRQAEDVADRLAADGVDRIFTSPYDRCVQSVEPLSETTGAEIEPLDALAEGSDPGGALDLIEPLAGLRIVMCSHGDIIPEMLDRLDANGTVLRSPTGTFDCKKASVWEVTVEDGRPVTADYHPPPA